MSFVSARAGFDRTKEKREEEENYRAPGSALSPKDSNRLRRNALPRESMFKTTRKQKEIGEK